MVEGQQSGNAPICWREHIIYIYINIYIHIIKLYHIMVNYIGCIDKYGIHRYATIRMWKVLKGKKLGLVLITRTKHILIISHFDKSDGPFQRW